MKKIAVLIDFTTICSKAIEFASSVAMRSESELVLVHVADPSNRSSVDDANTKMAELHQQIPTSLVVDHHVVEGAFFAMIPTVIADLNAHLVVVATHGKVGIMQNLLGANILKLVNSIRVPLLVVQESSILSADGFATMLFPVGPHSDFDIKYKQAAAFAKVFGTTIVIYSVRNDIRGVPELLTKNIAASRQYFDANGVNFAEVQEDPQGFSTGYAKHILNYARTSEIGLICINSQVPVESRFLANTDSENIILNTAGIPVLCTSGHN